MKHIIVCLFLLLSAQAFSQVKNEFFALHNIIRGDSVYNTFDSQVALVKAAGFDGIEINLVKSFEGMKAALDKHRFKGSYFYIKLSLDEPYIDSRLEGYIAQLKNSGTIIAPFITSESKRFKPSSGDGDTLAVKLISMTAGWCKAANLQLAIYPHLGDYVERTDHALALAKQVNLDNVGLTFNLCHWLATTPVAERQNWKTELKTLRPYLKMVTISGADNLQSTKQKVFDDYILPLGTGTYDTYSLVKYLVKDLKYDKPIGVQCYNIKADKPALIQGTMAELRKYKQKLAAEK